MQRFRIIVIEFHDLDQMFSRFAFNIIKPVFDKLRTPHEVVHAHPNNCADPVRRGSLSMPPVMEFTFYRKDRMKHQSGSALSFPARAGCALYAVALGCRPAWLLVAAVFLSLGGKSSRWLTRLSQFTLRMLQRAAETPNPARATLFATVQTISARLRLPGNASHRQRILLP